MTGLILQNRSLKEAYYECWRRGHPEVIPGLLNHVQTIIDAFIQGRPGEKIFYFEVHRQGGKDFFNIFDANRFHLKNPGLTTLYVLPQHNQMNQIMRVSRALLDETIPPEQRARKSHQDYQYPNGGVNMVRGADKYADALRGGAFHRIYITEAREFRDFDYLMKDILVPTTTTTGGQIIIVSTPAESSGHDCTKWIKYCMSKGTYLKLDIYDNPDYVPRVVKDALIQNEKQPETVRKSEEDIFLDYDMGDSQVMFFIQSQGGAHSPAFRREYRCHHLPDPSRVIIKPEDYGEDINSLIREDYPHPQYYVPYIVADFGWVDYTAILFGLYDFQNHVFWIQDEKVQEEMKFSQIKDVVEEKKEQLWGNYLKTHHNEFSWPWMFADATKREIVDTLPEYELHFLQTGKYNKQQWINNLRVNISERRFVIHPRCENLLAQIEGGLWNTQKTDFDRSGTLGHCDALAALNYLNRNIDWDENPWPQIRRPTDQVMVNPYVRDEMSDEWITKQEVFRQAKEKKRQRQHIPGRKH